MESKSVPSAMSSASFDVEIERILPGGMGLAHADGATIFVSLAAPGDLVRIRIDRQQGNVKFASIEKVLRPSPVRVDPPCPYFGRCGGCDFQQMNYEAQLISKSEIIRDCLHRITKLDVPEIKVMPSPSQWRYRLRATWQIDQEKREIGYYERGSRRVCDVADCAVLEPNLQKLLESVRATQWFEFPPGLQHLEVISGDEGVSLAPEFADFSTNELHREVDGESYSYNAEAFFQANAELLRSMVAFALSTATGKTALDLYCGVGLFTVPLARRFDRVIGVEASHNATRFARRNLQAAGLANAVITSESVTDWMRAKSKSTESIDFILLDPPRVGAESAVIRGILDLNPERICYVSCDPATLARDLKKLIAGGYEVRSLLGFDMFPQTHHVETIVHLSKG
jgi:23S rRNA (uracil1939-C5)-methyltransferase